MTASPADPKGAQPTDGTAATDSDDIRRMAPVYVAVIVVEGLVLTALWVFQSYFGAR